MTFEFFIIEKIAGKTLKSAAPGGYRRDRLTAGGRAEGLVFPGRFLH